MGHFGLHFPFFLLRDAPVMNIEKPESPTRILSLDMPWVDRSLLMDAIDNISTPAMRDGGRIAYLRFFDSTSWVAERKKVASNTSSA